MDDLLASKTDLTSFLLQFKPILFATLSAIDVLDVAISDEGKTAEVYSHTNI